jgi:hypothetical protein
MPRASLPGSMTVCCAMAGVLLVLACSGSIPGDRGSNPGPASTQPGAGGAMPAPSSSSPPAVAPPGVTASVAPLRRLNVEQYRNTIADLLGINGAVDAAALPADESIGERFVSNIVRPVQGADVERYATMAETLATRAVANLGGLLGCDPGGAGEMACVGKFIESFGKRAYRRPLTTVELERARALYASGRTSDVASGIKLVIQAMLQSVNFLYLFEPAPLAMAGKVLAVDGWSMASRLSYFFLDSMPDNELFAAAEANQLATPEQVGRQAARLMTLPRFRDTVANFHDQWLELGELGSAEKDGKLFPAWNPELRGLLREETRQFVGQVMQGDGTLDSLLTAPFSVLSGPLYDLYGVPRPANATGWQRVELDPGQRSGLLTEAGLMAALAREDRTSFIRRGKLVREGLLCTPIPDPPPGVDASEAKVPATADARQRAAIHRDRPDCAVCHALFDPLGFAFENYDPIGRYRTTENGKPIDARSEITATQHLDGPVRDAIELTRKLATADEVRECVARQWLRFALGRDESDADLPSLATGLKGFRDGGWKVGELLAALARSDSFRFQKVKN